MTWLSASELAAARDRLGTERDRAQARLEALQRDFESIVMSSASAAGADDEHDPEGSSTAFERQHVATLLDQAANQLGDIAAALERIGEGSYGVCERCGQRIGAGRLTARPTAVRCIVCAAARD
jgi:DnaK suppressor protein